MVIRLSGVGKEEQIASTLTEMPAKLAHVIRSLTAGIGA
jgi:hypothetical protein